VVDFRDLAVLDAETDVAAFRLGAMDDADPDIVLAIDAHHAELLIAHRRRGGLLHRGKNVGVGDVGRRAPRLMLGRRRGLGLRLAGDREPEYECKNGLHCPLLRRSRLFASVGPVIWMDRVSRAGLDVNGQKRRLQFGQDAPANTLLRATSARYNGIKQSVMGGRQR
jgi:hypothetical protein